MKYTRFRDVPQFPQAYYKIDVCLSYLPETLERWDERLDRSPGGLILNPEWQRGHVWTEKQKISFMEYMLRGGTTGGNIYFNCSSWQGEYNTPVYCVDGLQRLSAAMDFLNNKIKVLGSYYREFTDSPRITHNRFHFNMLCLKSKRELLKIYLDFNSGGTPHNPKELKRIEEMIASTPEDETL